MPLFMIIETEAGLMVAERQPGAGAEDEAIRQGGIIVDEGPYLSYDDAYDAIVSLQGDDEDDSD